MDPAFLAVQLLTGLASAASLFIISSGLTIVFGVTRIVNFAHGSLYMLGAYLAVTLAQIFFDIDRSFPMFLAVVFAAGIISGLLGAMMEIALLRRIYRAPELFQLLATFGVVLVVQDLVTRVWGPLDILGPRAPGLRGAVDILGQRFPSYELFLAAAGLAVLLALWLLMAKTRFGVLIRAATQDREMLGALGVNQAILFTATLFLGAFLAGLGGALQIPRQPATPHMDIAIVVDCFVVTVIGGMGSVWGAFIAALIIGQLQAFGILVFPKITLVLVFALMAGVLVLRPYGLFGRPEPASGRAIIADGLIDPRPLGGTGRIVTGLILALLAALPLLGDAYVLKLAIEVLIFALAAASLHFLIGNGGLVSFGHAAYFGAGAYAAGLATVKLGWPMAPALLVSPLAGAAFAGLFGIFIVRLSGIYSAMLTLAFAQILYAISFQWVEITGGDNGVVGVWPSSFFAGKPAYFYLTLVLAGLGIALLRHVTHAPFGASLRAARDAPERAEASGIDTRVLRLTAFIIAGGMAGLAGGLYAFSKGSIDPTLLSIPVSVDFLVMLLAGGLQALSGPLLGAAAFHTLKDFLLPLTELWRMFLGLSIIALVLAFPQGLAGAFDLFTRRRP